MESRKCLLQHYRDVLAFLEDTTTASSGISLGKALTAVANKIDRIQQIEYCSARKNNMTEVCLLIKGCISQIDKESRCEKKTDETFSSFGDAPQRRIAIESTIVPPGKVKFSDVAGLREAKKLLKEAVVMPLKYPHLFVGQRKPWRRILLFGPPGTGKSRIAKALSSEVESPFYSVSGSDLLSSWFGESEKLIKELFRNAQDNPGTSVIFVDEIDGLCRKRNSGEQEQTRRIKTELLKHLEDMVSIENSNIFFLGATNCPWELDTAFLRRFEKRIYIPLPDKQTRKELFLIHLNSFPIMFSKNEWESLLLKSEGYTGSDLSTCIADALFEPVRELEQSVFWKWNVDGKTVSPCNQSEEGAVRIKFQNIPAHQVKPRPIEYKDIEKALDKNHSTICSEELKKYERFTLSFGQRS